MRATNRCAASREFPPPGDTAMVRARRLAESTCEPKPGMRPTYFCTLNTMTESSTAAAVLAPSGSPGPSTL